MTLSRLTHNQAAYRLPEPLILEGLATGNGERLPRQGCVPRLLTTFFFIFLLFPGAAVALGMHFVPVEPAHQGAVIEYAEIWRKHGNRIVAALEEGTGIALPEQEIEVRVWEAISKSGRRGEPMYL